MVRVQNMSAMIKCAFGAGGIGERKDAAVRNAFLQRSYKRIDRLMMRGISNERANCEKNIRLCGQVRTIKA